MHSTCSKPNYLPFAALKRQRKRSCTHAKCSYAYPSIRLFAPCEQGLVRPKILSRLSKRLPNSPRQFIPYQPSKHHNIPRSLRTLRNPPRRIGVLNSLFAYAIDFVAASNHHPQHHMPHSPGNSRRQVLKLDGFLADGGDVAVFFDGDNAGLLDVLEIICQYVEACERCLC